MARSGSPTYGRYQQFLNSYPEWTPSELLNQSEYVAEDLLSGVLDGWSGGKLPAQDQSILQTLRNYTQRILNGEVEAPVTGTNETLQTLSRTRLTGSDWLIHACAPIAENKDFKKDDSRPLMFAIRKLGKDETHESLRAFA